MNATIFDYIAAALFFKNKEAMSSLDDEQAFNAYMLSRWVSMYSPELAVAVNETSNKYSSLFLTKRDQLNFFISVLPKTRFKKIEYVKKTKDNKQKKDDTSPLIAKTAEISLREVEDMKNLVDHLKQTDKDTVCQQI